MRFCPLEGWKVPRGWSCCWPEGGAAAAPAGGADPRGMRFWPLDGWNEPGRAFKPVALLALALALLLLLLFLLLLLLLLFLLACFVTCQYHAAV